MKKTAALIVLIVALGAQAIANNLAELNIRTMSNAPLKVVVDVQLISQNNAIVSIKNIPVVHHNIQIFQVLISHKQRSFRSQFLIMKV